jgi:hypothetical protein
LKILGKFCVGKNLGKFYGYGKSWKNLGKYYPYK